MDENQRATFSELIYSQAARSTCPRCDSDKIAALPRINPGSRQDWFKCEDCDHLWSQSHGRDEQAAPRARSDPPEGEGAVS